jgi:hypothetical protein
MTRIGLILGSTRPGRTGEKVAAWVMEQTRQRTDAEFELVDLADYPLPHLDERRCSANCALVGGLKSGSDGRVPRRVPVHPSSCLFSSASRRRRLPRLPLPATAGSVAGR